MSVTGVNLYKEITNWKKKKSNNNWQAVLAAARVPCAA